MKHGPIIGYIVLYEDELNSLTTLHRLEWPSTAEADGILCYCAPGEYATVFKTRQQARLAILRTRRHNQYHDPGNEDFLASSPIKVVPLRYVEADQ